jgi:pyrroline-5-carboxylate reductase
MLCIVGGGKMGSAIAAGLLAHGHTGVTIVEVTEEARNALKSKLPAATIVDKPVAADGAIIAVKPKDALIAASDAADAGAKRILSIAAGVTLARLHETVGSRVPVMRAMPNIGAVVGKSATALCSAPPAHDEDIQWAEEILSALGSVVRVSEDPMDAVTGLSGSGPAYVALVAEALIDAGVHSGLPLEVARALAISTVQGTAGLLDEYEPHDLREMVTTPAGTTAAGLRELEEHGVRSAFISAVLAARDRSHELGVITQH